MANATNVAPQAGGWRPSTAAAAELTRANHSWPGLLAAGTIAHAATWLSQHYGAPVMLFALLLGMAFHFLHDEGRCREGIDLASRTLLRVGVALLGVRVTFGQLADLGVMPAVTVMAAVVTTIGLGFAGAR